MADVCAICLKELSKRNLTLPCTHRFHAKCLHMWHANLDKRHAVRHCPLCKQPKALPESLKKCPECKKQLEKLPCECGVYRVDTFKEGGWQVFKWTDDE
jgi:hypothetical protein